MGNAECRNAECRVAVKLARVKRPDSERSPAKRVGEEEEARRNERVFVFTRKRGI